MNPKVTVINNDPCVVCGYPITDQHHMPAESRGGTGTLALCPNHHRCANILQAMIYQGKDIEYIWEFAATHFDAVFNRNALHFFMAGELMIEANATDFLEVCFQQLNKKSQELGYRFSEGPQT